MNLDARNIAPETSARERKGGLACAECRRSKLKCDRVFPCQSCIRRGCHELCPDGTLAATRGNRILVAHVQNLTEQVKSMTAKINELESSLSQESITLRHPLAVQTQRPEPEEDLVEELAGGIGSLSIAPDGRSKYRGETAQSELLHELISSNSTETKPSPPSDPFNLPPEIIHLANAFPLGLSNHSYSKSIFIPFLPPRDTTLRLANLFYNFAWMVEPVRRWDFLETIYNPLYSEDGTINIDKIHSHRLAILFCILGTGASYESHPRPSEWGRQCHQLARASFSLTSILHEAACATVQSLYLIIIFSYISDRGGNEERWLLTGLASRLALTIGLQRDSAGWNLDPDEVQRRRIMFFEIFTYESWAGLLGGRPPALSPRYSDCLYPTPGEESVDAQGEPEDRFQALKYRYGATCLSLSTQHLFMAKAPPYTSLLEIDRKIREFRLPPHLDIPLDPSQSSKHLWSNQPSRAMQQYSFIHQRLTNLMLLHRTYFAQGIREENPLEHKYAPSIIATYRCALKLIFALKEVYALHPANTSRVWYFWSGVFSSCVILGAVVVDSPGCTLAPDALQELNSAIEFYEAGSELCRLPGTLPMLQKLRDRAEETFDAYCTGYADPNVLKRASAASHGAIDELEVLGGHKSVIDSTVNPNLISNVTPPPSSLSIPDMDREYTQGRTPPWSEDPVSEFYFRFGETLDPDRRFDMEGGYNTGPSYELAWNSHGQPPSVPQSIADGPGGQVIMSRYLSPAPSPTANQPQAFSLSEEPRSRYSSSYHAGQRPAPPQYPSVREEYYTPTNSHQYTWSGYGRNVAYRNSG